MFFSIHPAGYFLMFWMIPLIGYLLFVAIPVTQILHKAGYSRAWVLIGLFPLVSLVFLWIFAFSRWPIEDRVK